MPKAPDGQRESVTLDTSTEFFNLLQDYNSMKTGPEYRQLKFSCADIRNIYYQNISSKIGNWFTNKKKKDEVEGIFEELTNADGSMVTFTYDEVITKLDGFIAFSELQVNANNFDNAEEERLKFKASSKEITNVLEKFSGELSDLVIMFAQIARVPVTL